jgi:hypothetical protein
MRQKLLWFFFGALIVVAIFWVKREIFLIGNADPDFNTVYSTGYDEDKFKPFLIGMNESELNQILGKPLGKNQYPFTEILFYSENKDSIYLSRDCDCVRRKGNVLYKKYRCFDLDSNGKVKHAQIVGFTENKKDYIGLDKEKILNLFGKPDDEIFDKCECEILSYSELTKGTQAGKTGAIHIRQVVLNRNKIAVKIIKQVADMYHLYLYDE